VKVCKYCKCFPCVVNSGLYEEIMVVAEGMEDEAANNKEIRHALYTLVAKKLFGRLGPGGCEEVHPPVHHVRNQGCVSC
jgi:hypothetical protein